MFKKYKRRYKRLDYLMAHDPVDYLENRYMDITKTNVSVQLNIKNMIKRQHSREQIKHMHDIIIGKIEIAKIPNVYEGIHKALLSSLVTFFATFFLGFAVFATGILGKVVDYSASEISVNKIVSAMKVLAYAGGEIFLIVLLSVISLFVLLFLCNFISKNRYNRNLDMQYSYFIILKSILEEASQKECTL
jgi:sensor histidine kinase YesM